MYGISPHSTCNAFAPHLVTLLLVACVFVGPLRAQTGSGAAPPAGSSTPSVADGQSTKSDSTLDFRWIELPRVTNRASGDLNAATIVVRRPDGTPAVSVALRLVLGTSTGRFEDARIEGAAATTDTNGQATFKNVRIAGEPRVVYLAVQTLDGASTSTAVPLAIGVATPDSISIVQPPISSVANGATLGAPRVRVMASNAPVTGVVVSVVRHAGSATLTGETGTTERDGVASFPELRATSTCTPADCGTVSLRFMVGNAVTQSVAVALRLPDVATLVLAEGAPTQVRSGQVIPGFTVIAKSASGQPVPGVTITARGVNGRVLAEQTTSLSGAALFDAVRMHAPVGAAGITLTTSSLRANLPLTMLAGSPTRIEVMDQPPARVAHDSVFARAPSVRVTDSVGNPVESVRVRIRLGCVQKLGPDGYPVSKEECDTLHDVIASLGGTELRQTTADGYAVFDSLRYRGLAAQAYLCFEVESDKHVLTCSNTFVHNPVRDYDNNLVGISAIKTISGVAPESEFFDLRFRFRLPWRMHVMSHVDIALTSRQDTGKVSSTQKRLTEASLLLNSPALFTRRPDSDVPERLVSVGGQLKVFGTVPYWGAHVVAMELGGSPFQGSSLAVAWLRRWTTDTLATVNGDTLHLARHNVGIDFFVRSATVDFFKILTIRGSIIAPFDKKVRLTSRIAIAVPIGSVIRF